MPPGRCKYRASVHQHYRKAVDCCDGAQNLAATRAGLACCGNAKEPSCPASLRKGISFGLSSAEMEGKLSALVMAPSRRKSEICSAICMATFSCASRVDAPRCGVQITLFDVNRMLSVAGSTS